jgi:hypothetical protein
MLAALVGAAVQQVRWGHRFMKSNNAKQMWDSATGVSDSGKKKGRRKGRVYNLNYGQRMGEGLNYNLHFPGYSSEPYAELKGRGPRRLNLPASVTAATVPSMAPRDTKRLDDLIELRR